MILTRACSGPGPPLVARSDGHLLAGALAVAATTLAAAALSRSGAPFADALAAATAVAGIVGGALVLAAPECRTAALLSAVVLAVVGGGGAALLSAGPALHAAHEALVVTSVGVVLIGTLPREGSLKTGVRPALILGAAAALAAWL